MKKHLLALGLMAAIGGPQAYAANTDDATRNGSGDTILVMKNAANTETLIWDLSFGSLDLTSSEFYDFAVPAFSASNAAVTDWINANGGNVSYNIFGLSEIRAIVTNPFQPTPPNPNVGGVLTVSGGVNLQDNGGQVSDQVNSLQQYISSVNSAGLTDNGVLVVDVPSSLAFFGAGAHGEAMFGMGATGGLGDPLEFWYVQQDPAAAVGTQTTVDPVATRLGTFTLTADALSYQPVPVPAAAWLFGSAIAGLAGLRRRRG